jgi:hypothetical protein
LFRGDIIQVLLTFICVAGVGVGVGVATHWGIGLLASCFMVWLDMFLTSHNR